MTNRMNKKRTLFQHILDVMESDIETPPRLAPRAPTAIITYIYIYIYIYMIVD